MNWKKYEVWQIADELVCEIHQMTLNDLPKFEMFETGSQIRRSIKSVKANIVEGFGRKAYQQDFVHFLIIAFASNCETIDHLETLLKTKSLKNIKKCEELMEKLDKLGRKLNLLIQRIQVENLHRKSNSEWRKANSEQRKANSQQLLMSQEL
jgi:four helix bundle protein